MLKKEGSATQYFLNVAQLEKTSDFSHASGITANITKSVARRKKDKPCHDLQI